MSNTINSDKLQGLKFDFIKPKYYSFVTFEAFDFIFTLLIVQFLSNSTRL
jgi:hypothetical protein